MPKVQASGYRSGFRNGWTNVINKNIDPVRGTSLNTLNHNKTLQPYFKLIYNKRHNTRSTWLQDHPCKSRNHRHEKRTSQNIYVKSQHKFISTRNTSGNYSFKNRDPKGFHRNSATRQVNKSNITSTDREGHNSGVQTSNSVQSIVKSQKWERNCVSKAGAHYRNTSQASGIGSSAQSASKSQNWERNLGSKEDTAYKNNVPAYDIGNSDQSASISQNWERNVLPRKNMYYRDKSTVLRLGGSAQSAAKSQNWEHHVSPKESETATIDTTIDDWPKVPSAEELAGDIQVDKYSNQYNKGCSQSVHGETKIYTDTKMYPPTSPKDTNHKTSNRCGAPHNENNRDTSSAIDNKESTHMSQTDKGITQYQHKVNFISNEENTQPKHVVGLTTSDKCLIIKNTCVPEHTSPNNTEIKDYYITQTLDTNRVNGLTFAKTNTIQYKPKHNSHASEAVCKIFKGVAPSKQSIEHNSQKNTKTVNDDITQNYVTKITTKQHVNTHAAEIVDQIYTGEVPTIKQTGHSNKKATKARDWELDSFDENKCCWPPIPPCIVDYGTKDQVCKDISLTQQDTGTQTSNGVRFVTAVAVTTMGAFAMLKLL